MLCTRWLPVRSSSLPLKASCKLHTKASVALKHASHKTAATAAAALNTSSTALSPPCAHSRRDGNTSSHALASRVSRPSGGHTHSLRTSSPFTSHHSISSRGGRRYFSTAPPSSSSSSSSQSAVTSGDSQAKAAPEAKSADKTGSGSSTSTSATKSSKEEPPLNIQHKDESKKPAQVKRRLLSTKLTGNEDKDVQLSMFDAWLDPNHMKFQMVFNYDPEMSLTEFYAGAKHSYRLVTALLYEENLEALKPLVTDSFYSTLERHFEQVKSKFDAVKKPRPLAEMEVVGKLGAHMKHLDVTPMYVKQVREKNEAEGNVDATSPTLANVKDHFDAGVFASIDVEFKHKAKFRMFDRATGVLIGDDAGGGDEGAASTSTSTSKASGDDVASGDEEEAHVEDHFSVFTFEGIVGKQESTDKEGEMEKVPVVWKISAIMGFDFLD